MGSASLLVILTVLLLRQGYSPQVMATGKIAPPEKFKGEGDSARRFFQRFELYAAAKEWTDNAKKATQVMLLLGDAPFDYAIEQPDATKNNYDLLKKEICIHYETGDLTDNYILEFQSQRYRQGDDPLLYMAKLRRIAEKAYPDMNAEAREAVVVSQFTLGLPVELKRQVHLLPVKPQDAAALVEKVKLFAQVDGGLSGGACARVESSELSQVMGRLEELSKEVASLKMQSGPEVARVSGGAARGGRSFRGSCFKCRRSGHMARDCPGSSGAAAGPVSSSSGIVCFTCGNMGHMSYECALIRNSGKCCPKCGNSGHGLQDCKYQGKAGLN